MTPLRNKMIRELELHRKAPGTIKQYVAAVAELAQHYGRSPDRISIEEVRDFIHHLITQRKVAFIRGGQTVAAAAHLLLLRARAMPLAGGHGLSIQGTLKWRCQSTGELIESPPHSRGR